jgi:hypothetical protein
MAFDAHKNFAMSAVVTPPSPPTTGASLTVTTGEGALFPAAPFNATVCPPGVLPSAANAEIVRVTARSGDVLTITRAQEGSVARAVAVGDLCVASITAKTLQDIETTPYARTDVSNTFTASPHTFSHAQPKLNFVETSAPAGSRAWDLLVSGQYLQFRSLGDDLQTASNWMLVNRNGDLLVYKDVYEKQRTTPLGHWIAVPFNAANFYPNAGGTWTVTSGQVSINRYTLIGKTLLWSLQLTGTTVAGATDQFLNIRLPVYPTSGQVYSGISPLAVAVDTTGTLTGAYVMTAGGGGIVNVVCGRVPNGSVHISFSMALEMV